MKIDYWQNQPNPPPLAIPPIICYNIIQTFGMNGEYAFIMALTDKAGKSLLSTLIDKVGKSLLSTLTDKVGKSL